MKKKKKKQKWIIEIKTGSRGWQRVHLLSLNKGGTMTVKFTSGEIVTKKIQHVHWGKTQRIVNPSKDNGRKKYRYLRSKKKRNKAQKPKKRVFNKPSDKWKT